MNRPTSAIMSIQPKKEEEMPKVITDKEKAKRKAEAKKRVAGEKRNVADAQKAFLENPSVANAKNYRANVSSFIKAVQYHAGF